MFLWGILEKLVGFLDSLFNGDSRHYNKCLVTNYLHVVRYATHKSKVFWNCDLHFKVLHAACSINHLKIIAHRILRSWISVSKVSQTFWNLRS